jgi:DNA-binding MarR family transcriptional regulator
MNEPNNQLGDMPGATKLALQAVYDETIALFLRMTAVLEAVHGQGPFSVQRRDLLLRLTQSGPQTVPQLARARMVSRQATQRLVNELAAEGCVTFVENVAHQRSHLVQLTPKGQDYIFALLQRERQIAAEMEAIPLSEEHLRATAVGLRAVRAWLEQEHRRLLKAHRTQQIPAEEEEDQHE